MNYASQAMSDQYIVDEIVEEYRQNNFGFKI